MKTEKQLRNTKQRTALLEILRSTKTHPNALWLYDRIKQEFPDISLSTVYRNLGILEKQRKLLRLSCENFDRYDGNTAVHAHFYCRGCERMYDVDADGAEKVVMESYKDSRHKAEGCNIVFYGVCEHCRADINKKNLEE